MSRLLVLQHVAVEPLGTLDSLIRARGHRIRFHNFERHPDAQPTVDRYRGLVVLGAAGDRLPVFQWHSYSWVGRSGGSHCRPVACPHGRDDAIAVTGGS